MPSAVKNALFLVFPFPQTQYHGSDGRHAEDEVDDDISLGRIVTGDGGEGEQLG